jgi:ABC-type spermidine/putrescine transport system permease subunit II
MSGAAPVGRDPHAAAAAERRLVGRASTLAAAAGIGLTVLIYLPVVLLAVLSVSGDPYAGLPGDFTLRWYAALFDDTRWVAPLWLSLAIASAVAVLCMAGALLAGRRIPALRRHRGWLLALFLLPLIVPGVVLGIQQFTFWRTFLGIRPGIWSLVLVHFLWAFPFALLGMLVVTLRFDSSLLEAAADLGASRWRRLIDIEIPLLKPGIATAGMFGFLLSLTELPRSLFVRGGEMPLPVFLWAEASARASHIPLIYGLNTLIATVSVVLSVWAVVLLGAAARRKGAS